MVTQISAVGVSTADTSPQDEFQIFCKYVNTENYLKCAMKLGVAKQKLLWPYNVQKWST